MVLSSLLKKFKDYEENKSNLKIFKVMKSMSKTRISHCLLSNTFNDKFWRSLLDIYIWVPHIAKEDTMKKETSL